MQSENTTSENAASKKTNGQTPAVTDFGIQRIYVKDLSFESPSAPDIFREPIQPSTDIELNVKTNRLADDIFEVEVLVTVTTKADKKVAFLVEVHQAGIFNIKGFNDAQLHRMLGSYCPNILFPYVREAITDLVVRGGFPPFYLTPVNFDALYEQQMLKQQQGQSQKQTPEQSQQGHPQGQPPQGQAESQKD